LNIDKLIDSHRRKLETMLLSRGRLKISIQVSIDYERVH
jgi:hypothetical protein